MSPRGRFFRASLAALAALGLFSLVFSLLAEREKWPQLPPGTLHDTDLVAGFVSAIALAAILAIRRPSRRDPGGPEIARSDAARLDEDAGSASESRPDPVG